MHGQTSTYFNHFTRISELLQNSGLEADEANEFVELLTNTLSGRVFDQSETIIASFESKLDSGLNELRIELNALDAKLDSGLNELRIELNALDAKLDVRLKARDAELDAKLKTRDAELDAKLKTRDAELDAKLKTRDAELDATLKARDAELDAKFESIDARFKAHDAKLDAQGTRVNLSLWLLGVLTATGVLGFLANLFNWGVS